MTESEIYWIILLAELGILVSARGFAQLLALGVVGGSIYLGSQKGWV